MRGVFLRTVILSVLAVIIGTSLMVLPTMLLEQDGPAALRAVPVPKDGMVLAERAQGFDYLVALSYNILPLIFFMLMPGLVAACIFFLLAKKRLLRRSSP